MCCIKTTFYWGIGSKTTQYPNETLVAELYNILIKKTPPKPLSNEELAVKLQNCSNKGLVVKQHNILLRTEKNESTIIHKTILHTLLICNL